MDSIVCPEGREARVEGGGSNSPRPSGTYSCRERLGGEPTASSNSSNHSRLSWDAETGFAVDALEEEVVGIVAAADVVAVGIAVKVVSKVGGKTGKAGRERRGAALAGVSANGSV